MWNYSQRVVGVCACHAAAEVLGAAYVEVASSPFETAPAAAAAAEDSSCLAFLASSHLKQRK